MVLLAGEPGIGKSRLLRALRAASSSGEPHIALSHFCSPYHTNSALHPVIAQLERAARLRARRRAGGEARQAGGAARRRRPTGSDEAVPLIAALLGIPTGERYPRPEPQPAARRSSAPSRSLVEQLAGLAARAAGAGAYEDVHWVDPSTLELLDLLVERVRSLPVLVVLTYRPEFSRPGPARRTSPRCRSTASAGARARLVERVTGGKALPAEVLEQIVARTDGVPLFVEELTKTVLESGLLADAGDHYELSGPLPPLAIPTTLHDSLMARLDRLAPVKEVAQIGAAIGREFSHELLAAVSPTGPRPSSSRPRPAGRLRAGLPPRHAARGDLQLQARPGPGRRLPVAAQVRRQQLHARIARGPRGAVSRCRRDPARTSRSPLDRGGPVEQAVDYWHKAGRAGAGTLGDGRSPAQLTQGAGSVGPARTRERVGRKELELCRSPWARRYRHQGLWRRPRSAQPTLGPESCARQGPRSRTSGRALGAVRNASPDREVRAQDREELLQLAERDQDVAAQAVGHRSLATGWLFTGELRPAAMHLERALALYDPVTSHLTGAPGGSRHPGGEPALWP